MPASGLPILCSSFSRVCTNLGYAPMLAVLTTMCRLVEADHVDARDAAAAYRLDGLGDGVAADVLGEVVERAAGEDRQRDAGIHRHCGRARHRAVAAADGEHLGPLAGRTQYRLEVVVRRRVRRSRLAGRASRTSSMTRAPVPPPDAGLITSTTPAPSGRAGVSTRSGSAAGILAATIGGTTRAPSTAIPAPMPKPANTSPG